MRVFLTGRITVEGRGAHADERQLSGRHARLAFAFLVLTRQRAVPRDELADVLWPHELPTSWESALRTVVSKVRAFVADVSVPAGDVVTNTFGCYQLHLPPETVVDVEGAEVALAAAEQALRTGDVETATAHAMAVRAVTSRPFLAGDLSPWAEQQREELGRQLRRAIDALAQCRLLRGEPELAATASEELLVLDPFNEAAYQTLIRAHAALGNRVDAVRAYDRCRQVLSDELGLAPEPQTEAVYLGVIEQRTPPRMPTCAVRARPRAVGLLVGRAGELAAVSEVWRAVRNGSCGVVTVAGEEGIGKTRLLAEVAELASADGAVVLRGGCDEDRSAPYQPFVEALTGYVDAAPTELLRSEIGWRRHELAHLVLDLPAKLPELRPLAGASAAVAEHRLFAAVASFLTTIASQQPIALLIDDVHAAGDRTLAMLRSVVRSLEAAPVLVVCASRDGGGRDGPFGELLARLRRECDVRELHLGPLSESDAVAMMASLLGRELVDGDLLLARYVHEMTGGNPLYINEMVRDLTVATTRPGDRTRLHDAEVPRVPRPVGELVHRRVARLSSTANRVVRIASLLGPEFDVSVLERASGVDGDAVLDSLEAASALALLREDELHLGHYRFSCPLLCHAVQEQCGPTRRARLRAVIAEAMDDARRLTV